jgi:hypothetical protein
MNVTRGHVYFIGQIDSGPIKIGASANPALRIKALQSGSPVPLALLASFASKDCYEAERSLHKQFARARLHGEWFERTEALLRVMDSCRATDRSLDLGVLNPVQAARIVSLVEASRELGCSIDAVRKRAHRSTVQPAGRKGNALLYRLGDLS